MEVANKYIEYHMEKYGFQAPNVNFIHGYIEKLEEAGIKNESYDIVMKVCILTVVNIVHLWLNTQTSPLFVEWILI